MTELETALYEALQKVLAETKHVTMSWDTDKAVEDAMYDYQMQDGGGYYDAKGDGE